MMELDILATQRRQSSSTRISGGQQVPSGDPMPDANVCEELKKLRDAADAALTEWVPKRRETIRQLEQLANSLQKHYRNATIATATGAGVATASFGLVLAGFITAPFTLGTGLILSAAGAGLGAAGGLTMTGSKIAEYIISRLETKEVQLALDEDRDATEALRNSLEKLDGFFSRNSAIICQIYKNRTYFKVSGMADMFPEHNEPQGNQEQKKMGVATPLLRMLGAGVTVGTTTVAVAARAGNVVFKSLSVAARAAHIAGFATSAALLPLDIYFLVKSSIKLHKGSTSEIVTKIRENIASLNCPKDEEVQGLVQEYIKNKVAELL